MMEYCVGQQLGSYRLIQFLGQGGYAHVYLGEHVYLKTRAAIKVLRVQLSSEHEQDFLREAQTLAHLEYPRIVRVLDFGVQEGTPFLVMQYAPKGSLRKAHPRGTILSTKTVLSYLKEVASALHYAHERKVELLKAREIFRECSARRDLQRLEQSLENPADTPSQELAMRKLP
jgi:eukaryotic-like serine/threonine-protein kinase